jgi:hypothetical protein
MEQDNIYSNDYEHKTEFEEFSKEIKKCRKKK